MLIPRFIGLTECRNYDKLRCSDKNKRSELNSQKTSLQIDKRVKDILSRE